MNFRHKYDQKCAELDELKRRWDRGDKSDVLSSEINGLLSQLEAMEAVGSRSVGRQIIEPDGPIGSNYRRRESSTGPFKSLGEQLRCVIAAGSHGQSTDERLFEVRAASGLSEGVPSDGGFMLQTTFVDDLLMAAFDEGVVAKMCRKIPVSLGNTVKIPGLDETSRATGSRQGGIRGYWRDEATAATKSKPKFRLVEMNLHKMVCVAYLTEELREDVPRLEEWVSNAFVREISFMLDEAIVRGSGAGQPLGVLNSSSLVTVSQEAAQPADTIYYANILKMWARLLPSAKKDAVWLINTDCTPQLAQMSLNAVSTGSAVYLPAGGASGTPYGTLMGKPVLESEMCSTVGDIGDIILGNFRQGYLLAERSDGIKSDYSIHVRYLEDEGVLKTTLRCDGTPLLNSAITPFQGSENMSHFVVVETR